MIQQKREVRGVRPSNRGWVSKLHRAVPSYLSTAIHPAYFCPSALLASLVGAHKSTGHADVRSGKCVAR